jgi:hypothetical protein
VYILKLTLIQSTPSVFLDILNFYLIKDYLKLERIQNRFLFYVAHILTIDHSLHSFTSTYSLIRLHLNLSMLSSQCSDAKFKMYFFHSYNGIFDVHNLLNIFRVLSYHAKSYTLFLNSSSFHLL